VEAIVGQFLEAFDVLHAGTPDQINEVTSFLEELTLEYLALPALVVLLQPNPDPIIRRRPARLLRLAMRSNWERRPREQIVGQLLKILSREPDPLVRSDLVGQIACAVSEATFHLALNFARFALEVRDPAQLHSAILLMTALIGLRPDDDDASAAIADLADALALAAGDGAIALDAIESALLFHGHFVGVASDASERFWALGVSLIELHAADAIGVFARVLRVLAVCCDEDFIFADVPSAFAAVSAVVMRDDIERDRFVACTAFVATLVDADPEFFAASDAVAGLLERFIQFALAEYDAAVDIAECELNVFQTLCGVLSSSDDFLALVWAAVQLLAETAPGQCVSLAMLSECFRGGGESAFFNGDVLDAIVDLIVAALSADAPLNRQFAFAAIDEFAIVFARDLDAYIDLLEASLLGTLKAAPTVDAVATLQGLMRASDAMDSVFPAAWPVLFGLLQEAPAAFRPFTLNAIQALCQGSSVHVGSVFEELLPILQEMLGAADAAAVECLGHLAAATPAQFAPFLETFVEVLPQMLAAGDDDLRTSCINALGHLLNVYPEQMEAVCAEVIPMLLDFAGRDNSAALAWLKVEAELSNLTDAETDDLAPTAMAQFAGSALILLGRIVQTYPQSLPQMADAIKGRIGELSASLLPFSHKSVTLAISFISEGMNDGGIESPELIECFCATLRQLLERAQDAGAFGNAVDAANSPIEAFGLGPIAGFVDAFLEVLQSAFAGALSCFPDELLPTAFACVARVLDSLLRADGAAEVAPLLPAVLELAAGGSAQRVFALQVLTSYAEVVAELGQPFIESVLQLALDICQEELESDGFYAIKVFVDRARDVVVAHMGEIMDCINRRLDAPKKARSDDGRRVMDCCVACLGKIVTEIVDEAFPVEEYVGKVLQWMPAGVDMAENSDLLSFFLWIAVRQGAMEAFGGELCGVMVRLFARSKEELGHCGIDPEMLQKLRLVFAAMVRMLPDGMEVCSKLVEGNEKKLEYIQAALTATE
jgi:hypothetical protein